MRAFSSGLDSSWSQIARLYGIGLLLCVAAAGVDILLESQGVGSPAISILLLLSAVAVAWSSWRFIEARRATGPTVVYTLDFVDVVGRRALSPNHSFGSVITVNISSSGLMAAAVSAAIVMGAEGARPRTTLASNRVTVEVCVVP